MRVSPFKFHSTFECRDLNYECRDLNGWQEIYNIINTINIIAVGCKELLVLAFGSVKEN